MDTLIYENYLDILSKTHRKCITRKIGYSHSLNAQTSRYLRNLRNKVFQSERQCVYCNLRDVEDKYKLIFICPCYIRIIYKTILNYTRPRKNNFFKMIISEKLKCTIEFMICNIDSP